MRAFLPVALLVIGSTVANAQPKAPAPPAPPAVTGTITGTVNVTENGKQVDASVVVYVVGPAFTANPSDTRQARIEQKNRTFIPDLVAITKGDSVVFPNKDPGFHNVFSPKPKFDLGTLKPSDPLKPQMFSSPGVVDVYCNIHPEMAATILVLPNRHHVQTSNGTFSLAGIPPGTWDLFAYTRRSTKPVSMRVTIPAAGGKVTANLALVRGPQSAHANKYGQKYIGGKVYP